MLSKLGTLAAVSVIALAAAPASAVVFEYTGGFQSFTAPTTGVYNINSYGAQGGRAFGVTTLGGLGAQVGGDFTLTQGDILTILVGGMGGNGGPGDAIAVPPISGGGGGGSFVYTAIQGTFGINFPGLDYANYQFANTFTGYRPLAVAAGGGGSGTNTGGGQIAGFDGQASDDPFDFAGAGGVGGSERSGPGAGYITVGRGAGGGNPPYLGGQGGNFPLNADFGADGDGHGGFGGGGGGGTSEPGNGGQTGGGGGGGGYNGGGGQGGALDGYGGYSYLADGIPMNANYVRLSGVRAGNGLVTIDFLGATAAVPEPGTWAMMIVGFGMVGAASRYRRRSIKVSLA